MDLDETWLETLLKKKNFEESVVKIVNFEKNDALGSGENYLSLITRIKADLILGSGKKKKLSLIMKKQQDSLILRKMHDVYGFFNREIEMYRNILPKMENLMVDVGDTDETLWSKCYDMKLYDMLLFEDLNVTGYTMAPRKEQLGLNAALFVVNNLAKFHAMSCVLLERSEIPMNSFGRNIWNNNVDEMAKHSEKSLINLAEVMDTWGDEWKEAKERVLNSASSYSSRVLNYIEKGYEGFKVLIHGDCWTNNMLFRFGTDSDQPISMKFLDLQLCYATTPAHDLHWFLPSSVTLETRSSHLDEILDTYTRSLVTNLQKFGFTGAIPSIESIKDDFNKMSFLSLLFTLTTVPVMLADQKDALDLEDYLERLEDSEAGGESEIPNLLANLPERSTRIIQSAIRDAIRDNII